MAAKLKVFLTSDGLTDYYVATSSKPKALAAWGVKQDLFKDGRAEETDDPALTAAALEKPGEVLQRPAGGKAPVVPTLTRPAPRKALRTPPRRRPAPPPPPPRPSPEAVRRLADLERRMAALEAAFERQQQDFATDRATLEAREARARQAYEREKAKLGADLAKARLAAKA